MSGSKLSLQKITKWLILPVSHFYFRGPAHGWTFLFQAQPRAHFDVVLMGILHKKCPAAGDSGRCWETFLGRQAVWRCWEAIFCREEAVYHFPGYFLAPAHTFRTLFWHTFPTPDSSCNSLSTRPPLTARSRLGHRGRLNKIVELSTPTPSRTL